jgi:tripartite-type tricarboxylate transporter receptor subunit TctC
MREDTVTIHRRHFLRLATSAAALSAAPPAFVQAYPSQPIRIIVGYIAGGPNDIVARLMGQWLSERLNSQVIVENRTGANGNISTEMVVRAAPDGHTILLASAPNAINATFYQKLNFNFMRDIAPVASINSAPLTLIVTPSFPAKTIPEFVAHLKDNPAKVAMASGGVGSTPHVSGELFQMLTGTKMLHVPYRGATPALTDLMGGQVQAYFATVPGTLEHIRAGRVRSIGVSSATRLDVLPDVPPIGDSVPGYETSNWYGLGVPRSTPAEIVERLNKEVNAGLADPRLKARLNEVGGAPLVGTPADFGKFIAAETEKWAKVVQFSGAKAD